MSKKNAISLLLITAVITACSGNINPVITDRKVINGLEQEYSFKTKALSASYLKRKIEKWLDIEHNGATLNGAMLVKDLEFARFKGETVIPFKALMKAAPGLYDKIIIVDEISDRRSVDSAFDTFIREANPNSAPVSCDTFTYITEWGSYGTGEGQFISLEAGIDTDSAGNVYVVDNGFFQTDNFPRVEKFSDDGVFIKQWGGLGTGNGQFDYPDGLGIDKNDNIYVLEYNNSRVQKFDSEGNFIKKWGTAGSGEGEFNLPFGFSVDREGNSYVGNIGTGLIQKFDSTGNFIRQWGGLGSGEGEFLLPFGIVTDSAGNVYVTDGEDNRVKKFDNDGRFIRQWGGVGNGEGLFNFPVGIDADGADNIYVVDTGNNLIQKFDTEGKFLTQFSILQPGTAEDLTVDREGNAYILDFDSYRVEKFGCPGQQE
jgi:tripartite motif-containing protein 71